jgi:hypothetical protein
VLFLLLIRTKNKSLLDKIKKKQIMELIELNEITTVLVFFEASLFLVNILGCFLFLWHFSFSEVKKN